MSAYIATPITLAVNQLAGSYQPTAPLNNLLNDKMGMVWRTSSTTDYIVITLNGASLDLVALWATNMTSANSVRVRLGPNADGSSPIFEKTVAGSKNIVTILPTSMTSTYLRLDFIRGSTPFIEVARLVVSKSLITEGVSTQAEKTYEDQTPYTRGSNYETFDKISRPVVQNWKCVFEGIDEPDYYDNWDPFLNLGRVTPFVFIPIYPTDYLSKVAILGRLSGDSKVTWVTGVDHRIELQIRGIV